MMTIFVGCLHKDNAWSIYTVFTKSTDRQLQ